ncbi:MAG: ABC transporter permease [Phycisphaerales bacterium]|nr:MAG: ABC transporter permease [Phycisphaerales bacterium]
MASNLFQSRSWGKFTRNRFAVVSLGVILAYLLVAVASFVGVITLEDTQVRVLPDRTRGFLESSDLDKRSRDAQWFVERTSLRVQRAELAPESYERLMSELALRERRVADVPLERMAELIERAESQLDDLYDALDDRDEVLDEILFIDLELRRLGDSAEDAALASEMRSEREALLARVSDVDAAAETRIAAVEATILEIHPYPGGLGGLWYGVRTFLGSDAQGRSISMKAFYSIRIAFQVGLVVAVVCVIIGTVLGAAAGFFGGWVDYFVMYLVSVLSSIPTLVLLGVLVYMFFGHPLFDNPAERPGLALVPVYCAMCLTFWVSTCRVIRGEVMKIKNLEYVQAATSIGFGRVYILFKHVIPNTAHLMFINLSLLFIGAIKSEVILSFLGLGVKGQPSWGVMISQAKDDISVMFFWEVVTASVLMFGLVLAFNILSDALQDAFDPKHVS